MAAARHLFCTTILATGVILAAHPAAAQQKDASAPRTDTTATQTPAQTTAQTTGKTAETDSAPVVITGKKAENRIDRQVYDVTKNADAQTGTASDALNKVPGVTVDPSGNVTLRGRDVQIYLNGRPSLMLSGDNRGVALQAMPSGYLSTIEVISNPGSQYASGSNAPIINIVTKRKMPPGLFGSVTARWNSTGPVQGSLWSSLTFDKLNLSVFGSTYGNRTRTARGSTLQAFDGTGKPTTQTQSNGTGLSHDQGGFYSVSGEYDFDLNNVLNFSTTYNTGDGAWGGPGHSVIYGANGAATDRSDSYGTGAYVYQSQGLTAGYTHYGKKPDETLKLDASLSSSKNSSASQSQVTYLLSSVAKNRGTRVSSNSKVGATHNLTLSGDYNTPIGNDQVAVGGQFTHDESYSRTSAFGPDDQTVLDGGAVPTPQPLFDNDFRYTQSVTAAYGTWQRELTDTLTVLGGLRAEVLDLDTEDAGAGTRSHVTYTRINPSVFATYVLSPTRKLRLNYVHRQHRPEPADLNPHLLYNSNTSVTLGNPGLRPQENDSVEGAYEFQDKDLTYSVRGFFRRDDDLITPQSQIIPDPQGLGNTVVQTTRVNFGHQTANGLSFTTNNKVSEKLTLSADITLTFSATRNPNISGTQKGTSLGGSTSISYTFANKDQLFISDKLTGKSFSGQGYTDAYSSMTVQYNRVLTDKLNLIVSLTDPLRTSKTRNVTDTALIHSVSVSSRTAPTFYIGLSRRFSIMPKMKDGEG